MLAPQGDLFDPPEQTSGVVPWRPRPLDHDSWPPDYRGLFSWRMNTLRVLRSDANMLAAAHAYYATHPVEWINSWTDTFDPRREDMKHVPFALFERQAQFIEFLEDLRQTNQNGLVEKCRDVGATWLACAYSVWALRYVPGDTTGWGSRKEDLVDKQGVMDSIFEKMRYIIQRLPDVFKPDTKQAFMRIINKDNTASVIGESGDNIGRGGRTSRYFKDEAAFYERPEKIEAALGDNTKVQIDISSVNGIGNVFHRRREAGELWRPGHSIPSGTTRVFVFSWDQHPDKSQAWYDERKAKAEREGMQHVFAQEVDRNYSAAVDNTIISAEWIEAAIDAHLHIRALQLAPPAADDWMAGLDVADEGGDKNALALRNGVILRHVEEWGERDPGVTTRKLIGGLREIGRKNLAIQYDCIGIGSAVKSEYNSLIDKGEITYSEYQMVPWHAGRGVLNPFDHVVPDDDESPLNRDFFYNMKAQAWWSLRTRFYRTWRARTMGDVYPADQLISLDSRMPLLHQARKELSQPTRTQSAGSLKMVVAKKGPGMKSPNVADSIVQCFFPAPEEGATVDVGSYSG